MAANQDRIVVAKPSITSGPVCRASPTSCSLTFAEVCERYLTDPTISRTAKSAIVYRSTFATITAILGSETLFTSISRDECRGRADRASKAAAKCEPIVASYPQN